MKTVFFVFLVVSSFAWAQVEPSLGGNGSSSSSLPPALRKANLTKVQKPRAEKANAKTRVPASAPPEPERSPAAAEPLKVVTVPEGGEVEDYSKLAEPSGSFKDKFQTWIGNNPSYIEKYKEVVHPDDIRQNRIELDIAPGFFSNRSQSQYSLRSYSSESPAIKVGAGFWLTPFFGINAKTAFSSGASIAASSKEALIAKHDWFDLSVNLRKFYGLSRRANSCEFGFDFTDYRLRLPTDTTTRLGLRSTGLGLHVNLRIPVAPSYAHVLGVRYFPKVDLKEDSSGSIATGGGNETNRLGMLLGGEIKLARESQFIWDLSLAWEKSNYSGKSESADPQTGDLATNASVLNQFSIFSFGYRWGN